MDDLADKLDASRGQDIEHAETFARRTVGLLHMTQAKWQARR
jgi:hypothetical protein